MTFIHWIHHLFNPHCPECQIAAVSNKVCESCETLKMQLAIANHEKEQMLAHIISFTKPIENQSSPAIDYEKVKPKTITWQVRKQMLEAEDRKQAQVLAEQRRKSEEPNKIDIDRTQSIKDLEKELNLNSEDGPGVN